MTTVTVSILIRRPVEEVFAFVTDATNNPRWQSERGLRKIEQAPDGSVGVGTRITEVWKFMGREVESISEVTEYEPNKKYARTLIGGGGPGKWGELSFAPVAEGTRVTSVTYVRHGGLLALADPLLAGRLKRSFAASLATLKEVLERQPAEHAR